MKLGTISRRFRAFYFNNMLICQIMGIILFLGVIILMITGLGWLGGKKDTIDDQAATLAEQEASQPILDETLQTAKLRSLLDAIFEAHGSRARIENLLSVSRYGTLSLPESDQLGIAYLWKKPNKISYTINLKDLSIRRSFDGETAFEQKKSRGRELPAEFLEGSDKVSFISDADTALPFFPFLNDPNNLTMLDPIIIEGVNCYVIRWEKTGFPYHEFYVNAEDNTIVERRRGAIPSLEESEILRVKYSEYQKVDGILLPMKEMVFKNDVYTNTMRVSELAINTGILDTYFRLVN